MVREVRKRVTSGLEGQFSEMMESSMILGGDHRGIYIGEKSSSSTFKICACYNM